MSDSTDFTEKFPHGIFDGFWWAFISMTTVGYVSLKYLFTTHWFFSSIKDFKYCFSTKAKIQLSEALNPLSANVGYIRGHFGQL